MASGAWWSGSARTSARSVGSRSATISVAFTPVPTPTAPMRLGVDQRRVRPCADPHGANAVGVHVRLLAKVFDRRLHVLGLVEAEGLALGEVVGADAAEADHQQHDPL